MVRYPVNLKTFSLISQVKKSEEILNLLKDKYAIEIKDEEINCVNSLVRNLNLSSEYFDCFYIGYTIPQISKEFDLIRIEKNRVVNIELKFEATKERIKRQLVQNKYYLSFLNREVELFTYIRKTNKFYKLIDENIEEVEITALEKTLKENVSEVLNVDVNKLFNPSNYLVSPFNSTEKFLEHNYFLTDHQNYIKRQVIRYYYKNHYNYYYLEGGSGTGKSLMVYDIARTFMKINKKVEILHVGKLNEGHEKLIELGWNIRKITELDKVLKENFDILILDEAQRLEKNQVDKIFNYIEKLEKSCIFSLDPRQTMGKNKTVEEDISQYIFKTISNLTENYIEGTLTTNIRSNMEIEEFIKVLFSKGKYKKESINFENIVVNYFEKLEELLEYSKYLSNYKNCEKISYTTYDSKDPLARLNLKTENSAHSVIGQEFENVYLNLDENFKYGYDGKLKYDIVGKLPYFDPIQMAYQIGTRAKDKLYINILNNIELFERCMKILNE